MEFSVEFFRKLKTEDPCDTFILFLGIYSRTLHPTGDIFITLLIDVILTLVRKCKQPGYPLIGKWIIKMRYIYMHNGLLLGSKKRSNKICTKMMDADTIVFSW